MKNLIFLVVLLLGGWLCWRWLKSQSTPEKIQQDAMVKYTNSLQNDVRKAEAARDKANAAVQAESEGTQKALEEAGAH